MELLDAVNVAIAELELSDLDKGVVELARIYARHIDEVGDLELIGPKLLAALEAMGATPRARATIVKGGGRDDGTRSPLDELRSRRERRAQAMDATAARADT